MNKTTALPVSEHQECLWLVEYLDILQSQKKVTLYTHIPNETYTKSWSQKIKNKKQGVKKGFPDYIILLKNKALFLEMKKEEGSTTSPEQKTWIEALRALGFEAHICKGFNEAKRVLDENLKEVVV